MSFTALLPPPPPPPPPRLLLLLAGSRKFTQLAHDWIIVVVVGGGDDDGVMPRWCNANSHQRRPVCRASGLQISEHRPAGFASPSCSPLLVLRRSALTWVSFLAPSRWRRRSLLPTRRPSVRNKCRWLLMTRHTCTHIGANFRHPGTAEFQNQNRFSVRHVMHSDIGRRSSLLSSHSYKRYC